MIIEIHIQEVEEPMKPVIIIIKKGGVIQEAEVEAEIKIEKIETEMEIEKEINMKKKIHHQ